jgi:hypothetical protein
MYKTRFRAWGVKKYRIERTAQAIDRRVEELHAQAAGPNVMEDRIMANPAKPLRGMQAPELASKMPPSLTEDGHLRLDLPNPELTNTLLASTYLNAPSSSNCSSRHNTSVSSVSRTPDQSRETSRPSSSDMGSLLTPESIESSEGLYMPPLVQAELDGVSTRQQFPLGNRSLIGVHDAPQPQRTLQTPHSAPQNWGLGDGSVYNAIVDEAVDQAVGCSSPSTFNIPTPTEAFQVLMKATRESSAFQSVTFLQSIRNLRSTYQDPDFSSPQPDTYVSLCLLANILIGSSEIGEAKYAMQKAEMIYQRLVQEGNDQLLSILNLVLTQLFLYGSRSLAAEILVQARKAASMYLKDEDPIMVSISFMISMALKRARNSDIGISKLRQVAEAMRMAWGINHRYCITSDYHLAWRQAMDPALYSGALSLLRDTQARAEKAFHPMHMQAVALINTQARVLGHLNRPLEAEKTSSEALQRIKSWQIKIDHPYLLEAERRHKIFLNKLGRKNRADSIESCAEDVMSDLKLLHRSRLE